MRRIFPAPCWRVWKADSPAGRLGRMPSGSWSRRRRPRARDTELTGDERIVSALTSAACRLDRLADTGGGTGGSRSGFVDRRPVRGGTVYHLTDVEDDDTWMWI